MLDSSSSSEAERPGPTRLSAYLRDNPKESQSSIQERLKAMADGGSREETSNRKTVADSGSKSETSHRESKLRHASDGQERDKRHRHK